MTAYEMRISDWSSDVCSSDLTGKERETYVCPNGPRQALRLHLRRRDHRQRRDADRRRPGNGTGAELLQEKGGPQAPRGETPGQAGKIGRASCRERVCQYV